MPAQLCDAEGALERRVTARMELARPGPLAGELVRPVAVLMVARGPVVEERPEVFTPSAPKR